MMEAAQLYPEYAEEEKRDGSFYGPSDYNPIIYSLGKVLIKVDDHDYQGDTRVLLKSSWAGKDTYGYLIFGWGSCSGCDALQACTSILQIQELLSNLREKVLWFDSLEALQEHFSEKDWEGDYSWHSEETKKFVEQVLNFKE